MDEAGAPFSMGWRHPVIVMPRRTAEALSPAQVESLLAHELGHIRRADYIVGLFQAALNAVCCLSPGHRRLSDEVRTLREQACDDLAVSLSGDVRTYATALGSVAHHRASAPLTAAMCAVDRHVAARIRRLLGDDGTPPVRWYRWTGAAALLVLGIATSVAVHAAASMPAGRWAPAAASQDAMRVHLGRTGIPIGFAPRQSGSPVVLSEVAPSASYVFDSVLVRNASPSRLTSVTFAAVVEWRSTPGTPGLPVLVVEAEPSSVTLAPGSSATVPLKLLPIRQALALKTESDGLMQVFLTAVATVTDAAAWSMPLRDAATHRDAMGLPAPTVPRSMVSVDPPTGPPSALCRTDESDSETSPGGIFAIRGEHGRLAKCVNGGWIEVSMDAPRYPPQKHEVQPGGRFHVTPGTVPVATPERRTAPDAARPRPMPEAAETKGAAVADTGGEGIKFRLTGGGGQIGGSLDGDFCCPEYLSTVPRLIQQHWNPTQQVAGQTLMTFTIQRNGTLSGIEVERSSGYIGLDQTAKRALLLTRQVPPLPAQYTEATLTVHLMFQYER